jgi:hypothetical protein
MIHCEILPSLPCSRHQDEGKGEERKRKEAVI